MLEGFLLRLEELAAAVVGLVGLVEGDRGTETAALLASPGLLVALGSVAGTPGGDAETARRGDRGWRIRPDGRSEEVGLVFGAGYHRVVNLYLVGRSPHKLVESVLQAEHFLEGGLQRSVLSIERSESEEAIALVVVSSRGYQIPMKQSGF